MHFNYSKKDSHGSRIAVQVSHASGIGNLIAHDNAFTDHVITLATRRHKSEAYTAHRLGHL